MKRKFATIITSEDNMNLGGIDYVADVMNHVDRGNEKQIFDEMDKDNPELSKSIRDKMFMIREYHRYGSQDLYSVLSGIAIPRHIVYA